MNSVKTKEEMDRLGISQETMENMKQFFLKTSVPRILAKNKKHSKN